MYPSCLEASKCWKCKLKTLNVHICVVYQKLPYLYMCSNACMLAYRESLHACGSCTSRIKDLTFIMCSWHFIKRTEAGGVKLFSTKTSRDIGMVPPIKQLHRKTNQWKKYQNKYGYMPLPCRCRDGEVCIQRALKLANVGLGCQTVTTYPSLFLYFFHWLVFHAAISTGFGEKHFTHCSHWIHYCQKLCLEARTVLAS